MKWLLGLFRKPAEKPVAPSSAARPAAVAAKPAPAAGPSVELCRSALAAATTPEEKARCATALGGALAAAGQAPTADDPAAVLVAAVNAVTEKATALAWLERVGGDAALAEVALHARFAEVRLAAARRIASGETLASVAHAIRERDKGVYRYCNDRLRAERKAATDAMQAEQLLATLRQVLAMTPLPVARLVGLEKEARALSLSCEAAEECARLLAATRARAQDETQSTRALQQLAGRAEALESELTAVDSPDCARIEDWMRRLEAISGESDRTPQWLSGHPAASRVSSSIARVEPVLADLAQHAERLRSCENFLDAVAAPADETAQAAWEALEKPDALAEWPLLQRRWAALQPLPAIPVVVAAALPAEAPAAPAKPPAAKRRVDPALVEPLLEKLEQALEAGQLHDADPADKEIDAKVGDAVLSAALSERLALARAQLVRLRSWARWGTDQSREHLCEAADVLLAQQRTDFEDLAREITGLRNEWKRLNTHGPSPRALWERFDAALEKAYAPVAEYRAAQARHYEENRVVKEALLDEFEAALAARVWDSADWREVETQRSEMLKRWRAAPMAGFRDERGLRKRIDAIVAEFDNRLAAARKQEIQRREALIAEVERLGEQTDLGKAIAATRKLQDRWRDEASTAHLPRGAEQSLWKRFRAGCDAVFARRDAQRAEQDAARNRILEVRQGLLGEFEAALAATEIGRVEAALTQFRTAWAAAERPARELAAELDARARELERRAHERIDAVRREKRRGRFAVMAQKAALAQRIEAAAAAGEPVDDLLAKVKAEWESLPRLAADVEEALSRRLGAAAAASREKLAAGKQARDDLLLDLEMALDLPSPEALAEARRKRQIGNLQQRFRAGATVLEPERLVLQWFATAAEPDAEQERRIAALARGTQ